MAAIAGPRLGPFRPGLAFASQRVLRFGIVLLGARLSLGEIARIGLPATGLIVVTMSLSFVIVLIAARFVRIEGRLGLLIAVGSAVCGNTAIVATAPVIGARAREVAYAVATITLFGTLAVFLYPTIGRAIALPQPQFGLWAGRCRPRHQPGHRHEHRLRPGRARRGDGRQADPQRAHGAAAPAHRRGLGGSRRGWRRVAHAAGSGARSRCSCSGSSPSPRCGRSALIDADQAIALDTVARIFIVIALAAVGMSIHVGELRETSWRPLAVGFAVALAIGLGSLVAITTLGLGAGIAT